jgi:hypothetical protein
MSNETTKPVGIFGDQIPEDIKGLKGIALDHAMRSMTASELQSIGRRILENDMSKSEYRERQKDNLLWLAAGVIIMWVTQLYPLLLQAWGLI